MAEAVAALRPQPKHLLVDGPRYHDRRIPFNAIIGGDATCFSIAAASILAKPEPDPAFPLADIAFSSLASSLASAK